MAELFIRPLVPQPIVVSAVQMTTNPVDGSVLTSDAVGVGRWTALPPIPAPQFSININTTVAGPWDSPQPITISCMRWFNQSGIQMITVYYPGILSDGNFNSSYAVLSVQLPEEYRPQEDLIHPYIYYTNGTPTLGMMGSYSNGDVYFGDYQFDPFTGVNGTGWSGFSLTYRRGI